MKVYQLSPTCITRLVRRRMIRAGATLLPLIVAVLLIMGLTLEGGWLPSLVALPLLQVAVLFSLFNAMRRMRRVLASYSIALRGEEMIRTQEGLPELVISQDEVTEVMETPGPGLAVLTGNPRRVIGIPEGLEGYDELKEMLGRVAPTRSLPASTGRQEMARHAWSAAVVGGCLLVVMFSNERYAVVPAALLVIVLSLWDLIRIQRHPALDARTKQFAWLLVIPFLTAVAR